jgi:phthalate 4,5-cis-dihydrodiol dehydrogenase
LDVPRASVIDAVVAAVREGRPPVQTGRWGLASLEICHAIIRSARAGAPVSLQHQIGLKESSA